MSNKAASARLRTAIDLHDAGVEMYRAQMRRKHPEATKEDVDVLVGRWLRIRPGAEHGDAVGRRILDHPLLRGLAPEEL